MVTVLLRASRGAAQLGMAAGEDCGVEHPVDVGGDVGWVGAAGTVLGGERTMVDGWLSCPSASWARDILPPVVCSIIVALARPHWPG